MVPHTKAGRAQKYRMEFPKDHKELDALFVNATTPEVSGFSGEYFVDMLTVLPSLKRLSHRKVFYPGNGGVSGCNVLFKERKWGYFYLEEGVCKELNSVPVVMINYDRPENTFITRRIRDYVRCIRTGELYLGRFNYILMGAQRFSGYFSLSRAG
ncbi:hypothetical protein BMS3Abin07_01940 [bacterium BMS3Abin07]|nr:hypothetical protein BMS3Abin07_01940 [bacterium BMS3Abin07]GBE32386.1 hypothetical protein BMS3Bbin05_01301 [bacterium BMS3Bbin05]